MAEIDRFLEFLVERDGSDLMIMSGSRAVVRIHGELRPVTFGDNHDILTDDIVRPLVYEILTNRQIRILEDDGELDLAYELAGVSRFRSNVYLQSHGVAIAFRAIPSKIRTLDELGFPQGVKKLASTQRGFILVCGPSGCGKTTTLASMVDYVNKNRHCHIITIEEPIEYLHSNINSIVTQRQVGPHTESFSSALRVSVRQDPDVIMVGEMRDLETMSTALTTAETGALVFGTLHTDNAAKTINRIINVFPFEQRSQVRTLLSETLTGVVAQQLLPKADGSGMVAACEVLIGIPAISNAIREGKIEQMISIMETGRKFGMQILDEHLLELVESCVITPEAARKKARNKRLFE
ncbi:MAG: type IV pilus twitching motility protein PilT [Candidatus Abyssobacteria bacterium SURF_17]|uniref:Type IV pilus twitching motility protein PilT n=1 Tax=Candidatus Abyssobacteria bacterium SURF_17 TaxID=2093361 RepID=A0A419EZD0_9BACT|nr:MAG: type IV pilus twitching motility protein PilT [Candidatus Abyssubacteria bacterium SURF_17]